MFQNKKLKRNVRICGSCALCISAAYTLENTSFKIYLPPEKREECLLVFCTDLLPFFERYLYNFEELNCNRYSNTRFILSVQKVLTCLRITALRLTRLCILRLSYHLGQF